MKKFLSCLILIFSFIVCSSVGVFATAVPEQPDNYNDYEVYSMLEEFITANPSRTGGTVGENEAAGWLCDKLEEMGYNKESGQLETQEITDYFYTGNSNEKSFNVIATKKSSASDAKTVVVGAHYDNATGFAGGQGAADNGGGVAVLLTLAKKLVNADLPYDVKFTFFGAEEYGMLGSQYFVSQMSDVQRDRILLMINIDTITHGDNLYVWGEDIDTPQADYFVNKSNGKVIKTPANKRSIMRNILNFRPYYNTAHASDSTAFLSEGIPVAFFFSGNLSSGQFGYVENDGRNDVIHSPNDSLNYLKEQFGMHFIENMESVLNTIYDGLTDTGAFIGAVENARSYIIPEFWLNGRYASLFVLGFIAIIGILAYFYYGKLRKRAILGTPDVKSEKIFTKPDDDDVFTYRD